MEVRSFSQTLALLRKGAVDQDLTSNLKGLAEACRRTGGKGSITLQLTIDPHGSKNSELHFTAKTSVKLPQNPEVSDTQIFYLDDAGNISTDDTEQGRLPLDELREQRELERAAFGSRG